MSLPASSLLSLGSDSFSLDIKQHEKHTYIRMHVHIPVVNTRELPHTTTILDKLLPSIYLHKCFNNENLPFKLEVKQTEIGHLFEHILLEHLCRLKLSEGSKEVLFKGETNWDWKIDVKGIFHITINAGLEEQTLFKEALDESTKLLNLILASNNLNIASQALS